MKLLKFLGCLAAAVALSLPGVAEAGAIVNAQIYFGNDAAFGGSANNPGSLQGFTRLRDRWNAAGGNAVITDTFDPVGQHIWLATSPTSAFSGAQVTALQTFLAGGGLIILSHDSTGVSAQNGLLSALGSGMQFGALRLVGTTTAVVIDDSHPLMAGLPNGTTFETFSPGQVSGGQPLVDSLGEHIISVEPLGGGHILNVADFDLLNNVPDLFFSNADKHHIFWDNILAFQKQRAPEPATFLLLGLGLAGMALGKRRKPRA